MKLPTSLFIAALVPYSLALPEPSEHHDLVLRSDGTGTCSLSSNGSHHGITFQTQFDGLTVTGEGHSGPSGTQLSLTVRAGGALVMQHSQSSSDGGYNTLWDYGGIFNGIQQLSLLTHADNTTIGTADHAKLKPFPAHAPHFTFTNGTAVPLSRGGQQITPALKGLPDHIQAAIRACQPSQTKRWTEDAPSIIFKRQNQFGIAPKFDDTGSASPCTICIAEAYAASVACGIACGASFGIACGCIAGIPLLFPQCHNPGTGLGQGCCPVGCGSGSRILGIEVVYSCCFSDESCVNPSSGACCASGLQACGGNTCCPSNAPCRDGGICCPTNRNTCITSSGPKCCNEGEDCVGGTCCPRDSVVGNQCCPPDSQTCCTGKPPSRCAEGGIQTCINNQWVFSSCPYPKNCIGIPVQGAGVACVGSQFCKVGQPSWCDRNGYQSCVNGKWAFTPCKPPLFCLGIPVQGAGVACVGAPPHK
jgi:hypothetical protein